MGCNKCYNSSCNGNCLNASITRQVRIENSSIGRDGESAYEIAVRLGFQGTESEYEASLHGEDGKGVQIKGSVPLYNDLLTLVPTPILGDSWIVDEDGMMYVYGIDGFPIKGTGIIINGDTYIPEETDNYFDI